MIDQINAICHDIGAEHILDNNKLAVWTAGSQRSGSVDIGPDTGLVGYPSFNSLGIVFRCLFNPNLQYGSTVNLTSFHHTSLRAVDHSSARIRAGEQHPEWAVVRHRPRLTSPGSSPSFPEEHHMARKTKEIRITSGTAETNRDFGKVYMLTEMSAYDAERWGADAFQGLVKAGVEVPDDLSGAGIVAIATMGAEGARRHAVGDAAHPDGPHDGDGHALPEPGQAPRFHEASGARSASSSSIPTSRKSRRACSCGRSCWAFTRVF